MVALISASDNHHAICRTTLESITEPLVTVWPAFTEAMDLLRSSWRAQRALWEMIERGTIDLHYLNIDDARRMRELMEKYRDLSMDLADAALVRTAEREKIKRIFTLDRDFSVYRPASIGRFSILPAKAIRR
jgi:predicted nucleic acid-binding protein